MCHVLSWLSPLKATPEVLYRHLLMGKTERPLIKNKTPEELVAYITEQVAKREEFYNKARYTLDVSLMDDYEKIQLSVDQLRQLLNI